MENEDKIYNEYLILKEGYSASDSRSIICKEYGIDEAEIKRILAKQRKVLYKKARDEEFAERFSKEWREVAKDVLEKTKGMEIRIAKK